MGARREKGHGGVRTHWVRPQRAESREDGSFHIAENPALMHCSEYWATVTVA